jgi:hypothetical protein
LAYFVETNRGCNRFFEFMDGFNRTRCRQE